jgi:UDP-2,3-diacylglucosamine pyrophosphatase LpxH
MNYDKIFISDLHLGTKASQTKLINQFLETFKTNELYLVGDIFDLWAWKKKIKWNKSHTSVLKNLIKFAKNHKVYYILGNHDEAIRKFIPLKFDNITVSNKEYFIYRDKKIYVIHGDQFDFVINKFPFLAWIGTWLYDFIIYLNIFVSWFREKLGFPYWSISKYLKDKAKSSFGVLEKYKLHLLSFCKSKRINIIIFGHLHMPQLKVTEDVIIANTGDWVENCSAIGLVGGEIHLLMYDRFSDTWEVRSRLSI